MKGSPGTNVEITLVLAVAGLWLAGSAYLQTALLERVPDTPLVISLMNVPLVIGLGVLGIMLGRASNALAEQNKKLVAAEKAATRSAAELEAVLDSIADILQVVDMDGRLVRTNRAWFRKLKSGLTGRDFERMCSTGGGGCMFREDGTPLSREDLPCARARAGEVVEGETVLVRQGKRECFVLVSSAPIREGGTDTITGTVTLLRDISDLKKLEKLKDEFISTASHELRTPLAVIRGYAQLQSSMFEPAGADPGGSDLSTSRQIIAEVDRMAGLVDQMLHIARIDSGTIRIQPSDNEVMDLTAEVVRTLAVTAGPERVALEAGDASKPLVCRVDPNAYRHILSNLITNAVKYSPAHSRVTVRLCAERDRVVLSVIDHGIGIPEDELPLVFEKFYRAKQVLGTDTPGLGLGLYITSRLVELQKGQIWAESLCGQGSSFHVSFPVSSPPT